MRASRETLAALVTAPGRGAVATVLVRGPRALDVVGAASGLSTDALAAEVHSGRLRVTRCGGPRGEQVVLYVRGPEHAEIHCHGGSMPARLILEELSGQGVRTVPWATLVRFEAATVIEAEAIESLAQAPTVRIAAVLVDQLNGALESAARRLRSWLDAGRTSEAAAELDRLLDRAIVGLHLVEPWQVAIVGRPNVGKSSLLNAIVGYARAIVHPTAGTTRDVVTAVTAIDGWPVELSDSAGIRTTDDDLEAAGVRRAEAAIEQSNLQLVVLDRSRPLAGEDLEVVGRCPRPIVVANKTDLPAAWTEPPRDCACLAVSALTGSGVPELIAALGTHLVAAPPAAGDAVPFTRRQAELLRAARHCVTMNDTASAVRMLTDFVGGQDCGVS